MYLSTYLVQTAIFCSVVPSKYDDDDDDDSVVFVAEIYALGCGLLIPSHPVWLGSNKKMMAQVSNIHRNTIF